MVFVFGCCFFDGFFDDVCDDVCFLVHCVCFVIILFVVCCLGC